MGDDLIDQLEAIAVKLETCGKNIQGLIQKKKNKNKHYMDLTIQVGSMLGYTLKPRAMSSTSSRRAAST